MRHKTLVVALFAFCTLLRGQILVDPGFENYGVAAGGFLKPASGPWLFSNDAGVVEPPSPNSSTGTLNTWSATFAAPQGQQYTSTYAGSDTIRQTVAFGAPGDYVLSVYAAAPDGMVTIPSVGTFTLGSGAFTFTLGNNAIGTPHTVTAGSDWTLFSAPFSVSTPGDYQLGVRNTASSPYFINYDQFSVQAVPEPSTWAMFAAAGAIAAVVIRYRRSKDTP